MVVDGFVRQAKHLWVGTVLVAANGQIQYRDVREAPYVRR